MKTMCSGPHGNKIGRLFPPTIHRGDSITNTNASCCRMDTSYLVSKVMSWFPRELVVLKREKPLGSWKWHKILTFHSSPPQTPTRVPCIKRKLAWELWPTSKSHWIWALLQTTAGPEKRNQCGGKPGPSILCVIWWRATPPPFSSSHPPWPQFLKWGNGLFPKSFSITEVLWFKVHGIMITRFCEDQGKVVGE